MAVIKTDKFKDHSTLSAYISKAVLIGFEASGVLVSLQSPLEKV